MPESQLVRERLFMAVKYIVYGWLSINGYLFFTDESLAQEVTFSRDLSFSEIITVYSASIDTTSWILLVILLELETFIIDDKILKRPMVKWTLIGFRALCYTVILYAVYGYIIKTAFQSDIVPLAIASACELVNQNFTILIAVEDYIPLTAETCQPLAGQEISQLNGYKIIAAHDTLVYARNVAWIDNFNSITWVCIVAILELDIWFQLKGMYKGRLMKVSNNLKIFFYSILFICAVAWGYTGIFLDFMDAFLWLFAFIFIEMNLFQWQQETEEEAEKLAAKTG
jgi:hypothetical protein